MEAAGYDGIVFDSLAGVGEAAALAQTASSDGSAWLDLDTLLPFFADHVPVPTSSDDSFDLVDLARGLFATHTSGVYIPICSNGGPPAELPADSGSTPISQDGAAPPPSPDTVRIDFGSPEAFLAVLSEHGALELLHNMLALSFSFGALLPAFEII